MWRKLHLLQGQFDSLVIVISAEHNSCFRPTGAISCNQEAYIDRFLIKYGMTNANACKLLMNPGFDLDMLPNPDVPDKILCMPTLL